MKPTTFQVNFFKNYVCRLYFIIFVFHFADSASTGSVESLASTDSICQRGTCTRSRSTATSTKSSRTTNSNIYRQTRSRATTSTDESDNDNDNETNVTYFSRVTRSGNTVVNLINRIERIISNQESVDVDSIKCILCCDNKKTVILLPCRHQHTCEFCWSLWRMQSLNEMTNKTFDEDDENEMKPKCPYCNQHVDSSIQAMN